MYNVCVMYFLKYTYNSWVYLEIKIKHLFAFVDYTCVDYFVILINLSSPFFFTLLTRCCIKKACRLSIVSNFSISRLVRSDRV